jgi:hypothetical protein
VRFVAPQYLSPQVARRAVFRAGGYGTGFDVTPPLQLVGDLKAASQNPAFGIAELSGARTRRPCWWRPGRGDDIADDQLDPEIVGTNLLENAVARISVRGSRFQAVLEITWLVCSTIDSSTSRS